LLSQSNGAEAIIGNSVGAASGVRGSTAAGAGDGTAASQAGVYGAGTTASGVLGHTNGSWPAAGVLAIANPIGGGWGTGLEAIATSANSMGVFGQAVAYGVQGYATGANGIGTSGVAGGSGGHAIDAICNGSCATGGGYAGYFAGNVSVVGNANGGTAFQTTATTANTSTVSASASGSEGIAVYGVCEGTCSHTGSAHGYAGWFNGRVLISESLTVNTTNYMSDERLKKDIEDAPYGLEQLLKLRPVTYRFKDRPEQLHVGFVAQEVQKTLPALVSADSPGQMLSLDYVGLVPVAIKALQEQQRIIEQQEARIARLEKGHPSVTSAAVVAPGLGTGLAVGLLPVGLVFAYRRGRRNAPSV
jgi:hypothetical protein